MNNLKKQTKTDWADRLVVGGFLFTIIFVIFFGGIVGIFTWPFVINSWLVYFGKSASVIWWQGFLLGMVPYFGWLSIPCAAATWILMLFL
jgi:hypothetical protein